MLKKISIHGCFTVLVVLATLVFLQAGGATSPVISEVRLESLPAADAADAPSDEMTEPDSAPGKDIWEDAPNADEGGEVGDAAWSEEGGVATQGTPEKKALQFTGMLRNKFAVDTKDDDAVEHELHNHSDALIGAKYVPNDRFHALLSMTADYFIYGNDGDWDYDDSVRLHNAYINWSSPGFNLKAGNQIVRWGKTDGYSPLDNVNPEDYRDGIAGRREDRKIPIPILNLELFFDRVSVQGLYIPVFASSELDTIGTDWAFFQHADKEYSGYRIWEEDPAHTFNNGEGGVRLAGTIHRVDMAVSWLYAREDIPFPDSMALPPGFSLPPGGRLSDLLLLSRFTGQTVRLTHDRQNIYGAEFESTLGDFGIRGDLAYVDESSFLTHDLRRIKKPVCQVTLGMDYNGPNAWYANLQYAQQVILDFDDAVLWAEERSGALIGTISKEFFNGRLKPECRFYYDVDGDASMLNPKLIMSHWEPFILELGAELFDGAEETPLGIYDENDLVYLTATYNF